MENTDSNTIQENSQDQTVESSDMQADIFEQVFNTSGKDPFNVEESIQQVEEPVESEPVSAPDVVEAKEDDSQFQYWQSQADKTKAEMDALKAEMEALKSQSAKPVEETKKPELVKPQRPVKPAGYDYSEALADPDSSSAKYLAAQEDYMEQMSDFIMKKDEINEAKLNQVQQEQLARQQHQETVNELQTKFNYSLEQANDFIAKMSSPESMSLDNLVKLHQLTMPVEATNANQISEQAQQKQAVMQQRQEKLAIPKPIGVQPGQSVQSPGDSNIEDQMMDVMLNDFESKNRF